MTIYICGDSTAASYDASRAPMTGWGQALASQLGLRRVVNAAMAGRSTKTFIAEGRLRAVEERLAPGDLLLIQFGHNDANDDPARHTEAGSSFVDNLSAFIDAARGRGALPVLLTPICIRRFNGGELLDSFGEYVSAVRGLAATSGIPLIDLHEMSFRAISELGEEGSRRLYLHFGSGVYPAYEDGCADDVHTSAEGAALYAGFVERELRGLGLLP